MDRASIDPVQNQRELNATYYVALASFAILYYDYLLTVGLEVERFWMSRTTAGSVLFYLNRYLSIFGFMPIVAEYFWTTSDLDEKASVCHALQQYHDYYAMAIQITVAIMLIMRLYAMYNRSRWVLALLVGVSVGALAFAAWAVSTSKGKGILKSNLGNVGCNQRLTTEQGVHFALTWTGLLAFDVLVFILTLYKSIYLRRSGSNSIVYILLRDGILYFGVVMLANLFNILTLLLGTAQIKGIGTTMTNSLSSTMISRLMLNLRNPGVASSLPGRTTTTARGTAPVMSTVVDPTGQRTTYDHGLCGCPRCQRAAGDSIELVVITKGLTV